MEREKKTIPIEVRGGMQEPRDGLCDGAEIDLKGTGESVQEEREEHGREDETRDRPKRKAAGGSENLTHRTVKND